MLWTFLLAASMASPGATDVDRCESGTRAPVVVQSAFIGGHSPLWRVSGVPVHMVVDVDGKPKDIVVADDSVPATFRQAALNAAARWRFDPALECGQVVARNVELVVPVVRDAADQNLRMRPFPTLDPHQPGVNSPRAMNRPLASGR
ncbi:energy transducer TonB [Luteimonas aestuarii]|nr:energy transducer TonB [Luteimonas aestuarii]